MPWYAGQGHPRRMPSSLLAPSGPRKTARCPADVCQTPGTHAPRLLGLETSREFPLFLDMGWYVTRNLNSDTNERAGASEVLLWLLTCQGRANGHLV